MPQICLRYAQDMPEICPRYTHYNWWDIISFWGDIINLWGHIISFWGHIISFWGHVFIGGTLSFLHWSCGGKVLLGVIINNWGHIITFWGRGFIGGNYHYLGARLLATLYLGGFIYGSWEFDGRLMSMMMVMTITMMKKKHGKDGYGCIWQSDGWRWRLSAIIHTRHKALAIRSIRLIIWWQ